MSEPNGRQRNKTIRVNEIRTWKGGATNRVKDEPVLHLEPVNPSHSHLFQADKRRTLTGVFVFCGI